MALPIKIELPEGFLDEETLCGYTVTKKLKQIWAIEIDLYKEFERVCKKYNINFSVYWGTMLGVVRHQGFIPWDDDLDVIVDRDGYEKLIRIPQSEYGENYFMQSAISEQNYYHQQARLRNSLTTGYIKGDDKNANNGIFLDIYVFDGVAPNRVMLAVHSIMKHIALVPLKIYVSKKTSLIALCIRSLIRMIPFRFWMSVYSRVVSIFTPFVDKIGPANSFKEADHLLYWIYKSDLAECEDVPYNFTTVRSIKNRTGFLGRRYKRFMEFPPMEERGKWHESMIHFEPEIPYKEYFRMEKEGLDR